MDFQNRFREDFERENNMINSVGSIQNQAINLLQERRTQILEKLKNGDAQEAIITGGNAFTESVWDKMLEGIDNYLDEVKEEQKVRFAKIDKEQEEKERLLQSQRAKEVKEEQKVRFAKMDEEKEEKELLLKRADEEKMLQGQSMKEVLSMRNGGSLKVPYGYLAKDGVIEYNGVIFVCDEQHNAICLGDMTNPKDVITIPLTEGGTLKVNRDNIHDLSKAISMFSPEDIRRIMEAIATDTKCRQMQQEMDETVNSITGSTTYVSQNNKEDVVTAEQIAELFKNRE